MTAKKKTEDQSSEVPAKATTGAWWKSTSVGEGEPDQAAGEVEGRKNVGEKSPQPARKRGRKKATPPVQIDDAEQDAAVAVEAEVVEKPKRKRAVKKKTEGEGDQVAAVAAPVEVSGDGPASVHLSVEEKVDAVAELPAAAVPVGDQAAIPKARRKRSPRKKRPLSEPGTAEAVDDQTRLEGKRSPEVELVSEVETSPVEAADGGDSAANS